ncbi:MAG TPA: sulfite exporter TauE/SafE family protein [Polyangiales bacterium]|nr:sulfite exporter TauE/SafE family protein [Polyangiales bacterium]
MLAKLALLVPLGLLGLSFAGFWRRLARSQPSAAERPSLEQTAIGFVTDFFDTLGIGSFATTSTWYRLRQIVPDRLLPGTLNVGHALPTIVQALIYIVIIEVDALTLVSLIAAAVAGGYVGAARVAHWPVQRVQVGMGVALAAAALLLLLRLLALLPAGADATHLRGLPLAAGIAGNFVLGALNTAGVGLYGPCMIMIALLGMNPKSAFPVMMGSCAFLMPVASLRFVRAQSYAPGAALGLTVGGIPGVLIAAYLVRELPLDALRWLVLFIALYTSQTLLRAAWRGAGADPRVDRRGP